jgi:hypothetical protein
LAARRGGGWGSRPVVSIDVVRDGPETTRWGQPMAGVSPQPSGRRLGHYWPRGDAEAIPPGNQLAPEDTRGMRRRMTLYRCQRLNSLISFGA